MILFEQIWKITKKALNNDCSDLFFLYFGLWTLEFINFRLKFGFDLKISSLEPAPEV